MFSSWQPSNPIFCSKNPLFSQNKSKFRFFFLDWNPLCCDDTAVVAGDYQIIQMASPNGPATPPMVMYPFYPSGAFPQQAGDDQAQGPGIYAIQQNQLAAAMGMGCYAPTTLVPLTYNIPT
jgi:hypothetical protein